MCHIFLFVFMYTYFSLNLHIIFRCTGVLNCFFGQMKEHVSLYVEYVVLPKNQRWTTGIYAGLPSIKSKECTNEGILPSKDKGLVCLSCKVLCEARSSYNSGSTLDRRKEDIEICLDRRKRQVITARDNSDAMLFTKKATTTFTPRGEELMEEAKIFFEFYRYMSSTNLPRATMTSISDGEVLGVNIVFKVATKLYKDNPKFRKSVIVSLLQGAVAKIKFDSNTASQFLPLYSIN